ncbi:MAG TPA: hypothetical protein VMB80_02385 [Candidatus Acidoferrum sp.]|nr:hypothetical protein [Candidatus Acidoferrum sp.]
MTQSVIKGICVFAAALGLCGCTGAVPAVSSGAGLLGLHPASTHTDTSVNLSEGNFVVVKTNLMGRSKGFSLLGFIPIYPAKLTTAMDRLYAQADIQPGTPKTLAHLVTESSSSYWILFSIPETVVRADVIQFNPKIEPDSIPKKDAGGSP